MKNFEKLMNLIEGWAKDKGLLYAENADKQFMKFIEEVFEFKTDYDILWHEVRRQGGISKDSVRPLMVHCLHLAYEKIKGRTGKTVNGIFIKQEDIKSEV